MQSKENTRKAISVLFTVQILLVSFVAMYSPFMAVNFTSFIFTNTLSFFALAFYLFDLKNVKGWWNRKIFEAKRNMKHREDVKKRIAKEKGMGYDSLY